MKIFIIFAIFFANFQSFSEINHDLHKGKVFEEMNQKLFSFFFQEFLRFHKGTLKRCDLKGYMTKGFGRYKYPKIKYYEEFLEEIDGVDYFKSKEAVKIFYRYGHFKVWPKYCLLNNKYFDGSITKIELYKILSKRMLMGLDGIYFGSYSGLNSLDKHNYKLLKKIIKDYGLYLRSVFKS